jgi:hypothetical protein
MLRPRHSEIQCFLPFHITTLNFASAQSVTAPQDTLETVPSSPQPSADL